MFNETINPITNLITIIVAIVIVCMIPLIITYIVEKKSENKRNEPLKLRKEIKSREDNLNDLLKNGGDRILRKLEFDK